MTFKSCSCQHQTSLIAGTFFQGTHLPLIIWFLAIYLLSRTKTGMSALALKRQLSVSYPTAWRIYHKLMQAMVEWEERSTRCKAMYKPTTPYLVGRYSAAARSVADRKPRSLTSLRAVDEEHRPIYDYSRLHAHGHWIDEHETSSRPAAQSSAQGDQQGAKRVQVPHYNSEGIANHTALSCVVSRELRATC